MQDLKECIALLPHMMKEWPDETSGYFAWSGVEDDVRMLLICLYAAAKKEPLVVIVDGEKKGTTLFQFLDQLDINVAFFPVADRLPFEVFARSREVEHRRVRMMADLLTGHVPQVLITTGTALKQSLLPKAMWQKGHRRLQVGDRLDIQAFLSDLIDIGYVHTSLVEHPGDFSVRGGIIDIYAPTADQPLRMEFFDDEIDSLRYFDVDSQRSFDPVQHAEILPARTFFVPRSQGDLWAEKLDAAKRNYLEQLASTTRKNIANSLSAQIDPLIQALRQGEDNPNIELFSPYFIEEKATLLDYYPEAPTLILEEQNRLEDQLHHEEQEREITYKDLLSRGLILPKQWESDLQMQDWQHLFATHRVLGLSLLNRQNTLYPDGPYKDAATEPMPPFFNRISLLQEHLQRWIQEGMTILAMSSDLSLQERFQEAVATYQLSVQKDRLKPGTITALPLSIYKGGVFWTDRVVLLPLENVFTSHQRQRRRRHHDDRENALKDLAELEHGDFVVHENHGIGQYLGMEQIKTGDIEKDYLLIRYAGTDKLYVPVDQFDILQKYVGQEGKRPRLNKLSSGEWQKTKERVAKSVADLADYLIGIYAARESEPGFAFSEDDIMQDEFEEAFPYVETEDQLKAIQDVKADMMRPVPMDRLICGDVGYGKTEVAIRAAFKAVSDGKQVAVLVPTTVLAQQHYETFKARFEDFGVRVAVLSRFTSPKESKSIVEALSHHELDLVIGTHKLLNKKIRFADLGLLVVDEEQRFGVSHKERLKEIKAQVDVLTLSATPIPRTLHLSLAGIRDMSVIETPPADRYPIQTYVVESSDLVLEQSIRRELGRGGQVFVIQNRIDDLPALADKIRKLMPEAKVQIAHGRMREKELETVMLDFAAQQIDVLVCTTIIETGLDIANANTLFVLHADHMGLAQLYQLRGRVGRSDRVAYAYLTYEKDRMLTPLAEKRLNILREYTALGSGYRIAMRDLELRGAGNLLGAEQHGHVVDVGFEMYLALLNEAVASRTGKNKTALRKGIEIEWPISAYLPETYVADEKIRFSLYKRLEKMQHLEEVDEFFDELVDRFGDLPDSTMALLTTIKIKLQAERVGIKSIKGSGQSVEITFYSDAPLDMERIMTYIHAAPLQRSLNNRSGEIILRLYFSEGFDVFALDKLQVHVNDLLSIVITQ